MRCLWLSYQILISTLNVTALCDVTPCSTIGTNVTEVTSVSIFRVSTTLHGVTSQEYVTNSMELNPSWEAAPRFYGTSRKPPNMWAYSYQGRSIAQAVSRWLPTAAARGSSPGLVMWDLWWTKWRWGRFSPSTSVSPDSSHSTSCSTITLISHLGLVQ
jgi:hypothetical protein